MADIADAAGAELASLGRDLVAVLNSQADLSETSRDDFLVILALQLNLQANQLGADGLELMRQFGERANLAGATTVEEHRTRVAQYFEANPLPPGLVASVRQCLQSFAAGSQGSGDAAKAARDLLAQVSSSNPVRGNVSNSNSLFNLMVASKKK